ncbi:MAG: SAM-dependent chlorinase/fluorinase [Candidatus Micrarchaeota archaeon]|nr:SAM-dependent chlorinase/fluorinase [Candidatus Micrarchaeota archaeon]
MVQRTLVAKDAKLPRIHSSFPKQQPVISLLTDFGRDEAVHLIKSAARYVNPRARIRDITHEVPAFNVLSGAWRLSRVVTDKTQREGTIYVAVVDPGVGGERECLIVRTKTGKYLVGPNNGLLSLAFQKEGIDVAVSIENTELTLLKLADSVTFHGKDIFAPAAAHLAAGVPIDEFGPRVNEVVQVDQKVVLQTIHLEAEKENYPEATHRTGWLVDIDNFGVLRTNLPNHLGAEYVGKTAELTIHSHDTHPLSFFRAQVTLTDNFESVARGELIAVLSSTGCLDIAANLASASEITKIGFDSVGLDGHRPITQVHLKVI